MRLDKFSASPVQDIVVFDLGVPQNSRIPVESLMWKPTSTRTSISMHARRYALKNVSISYVR